MKKTLLLFILIFAGSLISNRMSAQFTISGEFRPRAEYRDGYSKFLKDTQDPVVDILGRSRLYFDYKSDRFQARFAIQHAYVWGENSPGQDTITKNTLNIFEGWFQYNFNKVLSLKLGRMEIAYDNQRLIGTSSWGPQGQTFDAGLLKWEVAEKKYRGEFSFMINNSAPVTTYLTSYPLKSYKYMSTLYEQHKFLKDQLTISFLAVLDVNQKPSTSRAKTTFDTLYVYNANDSIIGSTVVSNTSTTVTTYPNTLFGRFTLGGTADFSRKNLKVFLEGYYQTGHYTDGRDLSAGFVGGYVSYRVFKPLTLLAGYEVLSGNDFSDTTGLKTKSTSFSILYPSAHSKYGYMDLFSSSLKTANHAGLTDLYLRATIAFSEKISLEATWRKFGLMYGYLPSKNSPGYTEVSKNLGNEFDFMLIYKIVKNFEVNAAYCFYLPTDAMDSYEGLTPGTTDFAQYAYIMLTYRPTFFTAEK